MIVCLVCLVHRFINIFFFSAVIMFVVQPDEVNVYDQRLLEYRIHERLTLMLIAWHTFIGWILFIITS